MKPLLPKDKIVVFFSRFVCIFFLFLGLSLNAYGEEHFATLESAHDAKSKKNYLLAALKFSRYLEQDSTLADYALFWRAESYYKLKENSEALKDIAKIKKDYPRSPVMKKALKLEIEINENTSQLIQLMEDYLELYPKENEVRLKLAKLLVAADEKNKAQKEFLKLYASGGKYPSDALRVDNITTAIRLERADNLIKKYKYDAARKELIAISDSAIKDGALKCKKYSLLGKCRFKKKKYIDAANFFNSAGDYFMKARSEFRARRYKDFARTLSILLAEKDNRAYELKMIYGIHKRRTGHIADAIKTFKELEKISHLEGIKEEAIWHQGWTYYLTGSSKKALKIFENLYDSYGKSKYLYWAVHAGKQVGVKEHKHRQRLADPCSGSSNNNRGYDCNRDFYSLLYKLENNIDFKAKQIIIPSEQKASSVVKRLDALLHYDFGRAYRTESFHILRNIDAYSIKDIQMACELLQNASKHRLAILIAEKAKDSDTLKKYLYPYAYRQEVDRAASRFGLDPFLMLAIIRQESRFQHDALSGAHALGLMQLIKPTAKRLAKRAKVSIKSKWDILKPKKNLLLGAAYLDLLQSKFQCMPAVIASYNAGEGIVKKWLKRTDYKYFAEFIEDIPYDETKNYVKNVIMSYTWYIKLWHSGKKGTGSSIIECQSL